MSEFKWDIVKELHAPARKNFNRRHVDIRNIDETWQADLVEMIPYSKENQGYKYLLTIIDIFSKFAWGVPIKNKTGKEVSTAMESIFKGGRVPKNLHVDNGLEFYNSTFQLLMKKYKIHMYSTFTHLKASICERFNRTLKRKMWMKFSFQGNYKWIKILSEIISEYNNTKHRTIKMKPKEVKLENVENLKKNIYSLNNLPLINSMKFKLNDNVRISKYKHIFEKGYIPNWTNEIFKINKINKTKPITYKLKDYRDNPIEGCFYREELLKVKHPDVFLIEKVIKTRGNKMYVKWLGFDDSHNQWINK